MQDNKHLSYAMFTLTISYIAIYNNKDLNKCIACHFSAIGEVNNITNKEIRDEITETVSSIISEITNHSKTLQITTKQKDDFLKIAEKSSNKKELQRIINNIKITS